ncbi:O-antigen/teichoic acid export membrane protein [Variovorax paradoxus]|uniref:oligosaccharide flippase family protein n=1 Tax=Variovorax paradoxus TaxID=34073 RepID=UPI00278BA85C|nr:oligosaccharide flippase family protein [Variovorax paradoxus]MDP9963016.1 O-antigen/teichoic acid export membrane protein [Variovorax paradoxus]
MPVPNVMRAMCAKFRALHRAGFVRSVGVLVGGTAFAQAITILALPLLTRLYTPVDFNLLAVFASILSLLSVVACLRLEIAIPLPENDEDAVNLLAVALCLCSAVAVLTALVVWQLPAQIAVLIGQPALSPHLWLLPLGVWLAGSYAALQFWSTRKKRFGAIAKTRMSQAIAGAGSQIGLGLAQLTPFGLLLGQIISSGAGLLGLGRDALRDDRSPVKKINWAGMRQMTRTYDQFPKYSTFEAFANSASTQLPVIVIAALSMGPEAGYLILAMRAMAAPMGLIGNAVSQVYLSRAPEELRAGRLANFTLQIIGGLAKSGVGPLIFAGVVSPLAFPLIFGHEWLRAGELVAWMTPWFILQFLASPVSMTLHVTGNQRAALNLQIFGLVLRVGAVGIAGRWMSTHVVEIYAISGFLFYGLYLYVVARFSGIRPGDLYMVLRKSFRTLLIWMGAGAAVVSVPALTDLWA